jgi:hypothetical protein
VAASSRPRGSNEAAAGESLVNALFLAGQSSHEPTAINHRVHSQLLTFPWEKTSMRRFCSGIAGVVVAFTLAGCGESEPEGPVQFKATNPAGLDKQLDIMSENQKNKAFTKKQTETKPPDQKPAEPKPADK